MDSGVDVSIIIVNYNCGGLLEQCVRSITRTLRDNYEVVIVDNNSTDTSLDFFQGDPGVSETVNVIKNRDNYGFAVANNIGVERARGRYLHFLNPDTVVDESLNAAYARVLSSDSDRIYVTPLRDVAGRVVKSYHVLPLVTNYITALLQPAKARYWYLGASVIMKRELFEQLGRWPADYFMYSEDLDLFYRAALAGVAVEMLDAPVTHVSKGSTGKVWDEFNRRVMAEASYVKFSQKYRRMWDYYMLTGINLLRRLFKNPREVGMDLRVFLAVSRNRLRSRGKGPVAVKPRI